MAVIKKIWNSFRELFGFKRNDKYVSNHLNEANVRSSIYMSVIIIILEVWMIIRQTNKYIIPHWSDADYMKKYGYLSNFHMTFNFLSLYFLFIFGAVAVLVFAISHVKKSTSEKALVAHLIAGGFCILSPLGLISQMLGSTLVDEVTILSLYMATPLLGLAIIFNFIYQRKKNRSSTILSIVIITLFAALCLLFGLKVGYSDFIHPTRPKMIICFLTMMVFVACLLIWKPYISIIMLTIFFMAFKQMLVSYGNLEEGNRLLEEGDFINYITFLISLAMVTISIYQQRVEEAKKDEKLIHDAAFDSQIEIHNTRYIVKEVENASSFDPCYLENKIFLFFNISNFKAYNEQKGFDKGDQFLNAFAYEIMNQFSSDLPSRLSGDHFVVFADRDNLESKINYLNETLLKMSEGVFIQLKVGGYIPKFNESVTHCIEKARYACSRIENKYGKNYLEYDDELHLSYKRRQYIVNNLDLAIENGWIKAYYQPVVWSQTKELCGAEALARWIDPKYGFLSPADFIPILEETQLIHKLDAYIIKDVCKNLRLAIDAGATVVPISINLSRLDFEMMDILGLLEQTIKEYGIDKNYLHVEITESAIAENTSLLKQKALELKENGYAIWLDDFGSGYSSLNVLKEFNFDVIKIDMKFLSHFDENAKTKDILDCIVNLANRLGMKTLTEGVETDNQAEYLDKIGCGRLQGYLFGKPIPLEEFIDKIDKKVFTISKTL